jgi:hypothetical protein
LYIVNSIHPELCVITFSLPLSCVVLGPVCAASCHWAAVLCIVRCVVGLSLFLKSLMCITKHLSVCKISGIFISYHLIFTIKTPWPESTSEQYRPSDCRLSAKLVPTFAERGCHVVSVTDPHGCILGFLDWSRCCFSQVAPQLY